MKTNNPRSPKSTQEDGGNGHRTGNGNGGSSRPHAGPIKRAAGPFYGSGKAEEVSRSILQDSSNSDPK